MKEKTKMINEYIQNRIEEIARGNKWDFEGIEYDGTAAFLIEGEHEEDYQYKYIDITPCTFWIYDIVPDNETGINEQVTIPVSKSWEENNLETVARVQELLRFREALAGDIKETEKKLANLISDMEVNLSRAKEIKREVENG